MGKPVLYGFEEYATSFGTAHIFDNVPWFRTYYYGTHSPSEYHVPVQLIGMDENEDRYVLDVKEHPELLETAKNVYVYPGCTIPRDLVMTKYKKKLNPWEADVVIVPDNNDSFKTRNIAAFMSLNNTLILFGMDYHTDRDETLMDRMKNTPIGTKLSTLVNPNMDNLSGHEDDELVFIGKVVEFDAKRKYAMDIALGVLPTDKLVCEKTLLHALGSESNAPDFESMKSVGEMLDSQDSSMVTTGLKALAALDYARFPQSAITVLNRTGMWRYNSAMNATAVKYMLKHLGYYRNRYFTYRSRYISQEDYDLTKQLIMHFDKLGEDSYLEFCYSLPFVYVDSDNNVHPRLLQEEE